MIQNGEVSSISNTKRKKISRWRIFDTKKVTNLLPKNLVLDAGFHFKDCLNEHDFEAMTSGMLEMQLKLGQNLLNQSDLVNNIQQKVLVFDRLAHAYRKTYQTPPKTVQRDENSQPRGSLASIGKLLYLEIFCESECCNKWMPWFHEILLTYSNEIFQIQFTAIFLVKRMHLFMNTSISRVFHVHNFMKSLKIIQFVAIFSDKQS